ncbi:nitroreductase family protein [Actinokineospora sp. NPDC004072]
MTAHSPRWTCAEEAVLVAAVDRAPSVHGTRPWALETRDRDALVIERAALRLPRQDPFGRDRLISCGAAVATLRLACRGLGWTESWRQFPLPERRDVVAVVRAGERKPSDRGELARYAAIGARRSHRARFAAPPPVAARAALLKATDVAGAAVVLLAGPERDAAVGRLLTHAADHIGNDPAYRAELAAWCGPEADPRLWSGLGAEADQHPGGPTLADRLADEAHLVVITTGDGRSDHLHAGIALQQTWLAATALGLAASAVTLPLHLHEVRAGLVEAAELPGFPQAILRVGVPAVGPAPRSRRPPAALPRTPGKVR